MRKIENWNEIEINEYTENERLTLGGHKCIIKNVKNYIHNGIEKVSLELDILDDEHKNFYQKKYDERPENAKFWDDGATLSFLAEPVEDRDKSYFKGLIKAIESYNDGYTWNWDEQTLKNKLINVNFSLKEYEGNDGKIYTKPQVSRFVNSKDNFKKDFIPSVRTLNNGFIKYEDYIKSDSQKTAEEVFGASIVETDSGNSTMLEL